MLWVFNEIAKGKYSINQIRLNINAMEGGNISSTSFYRTIKILCNVVKYLLKLTTMKKPVLLKLHMRV